MKEQLIAFDGGGQFRRKSFKELFLGGGVYNICLRTKSVRKQMRRNKRFFWCISTGRAGLQPSGLRNRTERLWMNVKVRISLLEIHLTFSILQPRDKPHEHKAAAHCLQYDPIYSLNHTSLNATFWP